MFVVGKIFGHECRLALFGRSVNDNLLVSIEGIPKASVHFRALHIRPNWLGTNTKNFFEFWQLVLLDDFGRLASLTRGRSEWKQRKFSALP
jgi:hypothetical protein